MFDRSQSYICAVNASTFKIFRNKKNINTEICVISKYETHVAKLKQIYNSVKAAVTVLKKTD